MLVMKKDWKALHYLARNVADINDHWLKNATETALRGMIIELREDAREALDAAA